jgi:hypothetical protein
VLLNGLSTEQVKYSDELMTVKLRYKQPGSAQSSLVSHAVKGVAVSIDRSSTNFRFATAVASFGMMLRNSEHKGDASYTGLSVHWHRVRWERIGKDTGKNF